MNFTWEDRFGRGTIGEYTITEKPELSFTYAWISVTDDSAMFVQSHEDGYSNVNLTTAQRMEVEDYVNAWEVPLGTEPGGIVLSTEALLEARKDRIRSEFAATLVDGVTIDGVKWRAGMDSASSILVGIRSAEYYGETEMSPRDFNRVKRTMPLADAYALSAAIGAHWKPRWEAKEDAMEALMNIDVTSETARADILAITYDFVE